MVLEKLVVIKDGGCDAQAAFMVLISLFVVVARYAFVIFRMQM